VEEGLIVPLVVAVAELGVTEVPLAEKAGGVTGLTHHFGDGDLVTVHTGVFHGKGHGVHTAAHGVAAGLESGACGGAGRLRVHAHEVDPLFGHLVHVGRFKTPDRLDFGDTNFTKGRIIPHDVNNVWCCTVLFFQLGQLFIDFFILFRPLFPVLGFEYIVLSVVYDLDFRLGRSLSNQAYSHEH
jgi:hypothetical protein